MTIADLSASNRSVKRDGMSELTLTAIRYPYPLFGMLSPSSRGAVFAGSAFMMTVSAALLRFVYGRVNPRQTTPESWSGAIGKR